MLGTFILLGMEESHSYFLTTICFYHLYFFLNKWNHNKIIINISHLNQNNNATISIE